MQKVVTIIILILIAKSTFSQDTLTISNKRTPFFALKWSPLKLLTGDWVTNSRAIQVGGEYILKSKYSVEQDIGYIFNGNKENIGILTVGIETIKGIRSETQVKQYFSQNYSKLEGVFIGIHFLYQITKATRTETVGNYSTGYYKNNYDVYRNVLGSHIMLGWQIILKSNLVFELEGGIGARYISSKPLNRKEENGTYEFPYHKIYDKGEKLFPSVTGSLKIGWAFKRSKNL